MSRYDTIYLREEIDHPPRFFLVFTIHISPFTYCIHIITSLVDVRLKYQPLWSTACQSTEENKWRCFKTLRFIQLDNFEVKYLPLPESYNTNFEFSFIIHRFVSEYHQKNLWVPSHFCLLCLLKSATVTSFSQLHLQRNSGSRRSLDQRNPHFIARYTRWLIKKSKKWEKLWRLFCRNGKFHV